MELKDTVEMMFSEDYKERFRAEYYQLKIRCEKLNKFLLQVKVSEKYNGLYTPKHDCPSELLENQLLVMEEYLNVLRERALIESINID